MRPEVRIVAAVLAVFVAGYAMVKFSGWAKVRRENRQWIAAENLTPDRLIARCGQPMEDNTKNLYPMVARELRYKSSDHGTIVLAFSRTAEEGSDWVFMSMKNVGGGMEYDTPEAKITAMPCLDSRK